MQSEIPLVLDTQSDLVLFQFPLARELPKLAYLKIKEKGGILESSDLQQSRKLTGTLSPLFVPGPGKPCSDSAPLYETTMSRPLHATPYINSYYVLSVTGSGISGKILRAVSHLRPVLEDPEETVAKSSLKEKEKTFAQNETQEEAAARMRNPNYAVEMLLQEPWKDLDRDSTPNTPDSCAGSFLNDPKRAGIDRGRTESQKVDAVISADILACIYNARVSSLGSLSQIFPDIPTAILEIGLRQLTVKKHGRYFLRPEFYDDLEDVYTSILDRLESRDNNELIFRFVPNEVMDPDERLLYVLNQIGHRNGAVYTIKGS